MNEHDYVSIITDIDKEKYIMNYRKNYIFINYKNMCEYLSNEKIIFDSDLNNYICKLSSDISKLVIDDDNNNYLNFLNIKFPRNEHGFIIKNYLIHVIELFTKLMSNGYNVKYNYSYQNFNICNSAFSFTNLSELLNRNQENNVIISNVFEKELKRFSKEDIAKKLLIIDSVDIIPYFTYDTQCDFVLDALTTPIVINFDSRPIIKM